MIYSRESGLCTVSKCTQPSHFCCGTNHGKYFLKSLMILNPYLLPFVVAAVYVCMKIKIRFRVQHCCYTTIVNPVA